ncbi:MAG: hypothetical protein ACJ712_02265, partial [Nitrososphaeraceae archaeon]
INVELTVGHDIGVSASYYKQTVKKIRFIVIDPNSGSSQEKFFDVGRRSARLIIAKLKEGYTPLKIERIGSKRYTLYTNRSHRII